MPHALGRRIRADQIGESRLQRLVPADQRVVFLIGDLGRIFGMIEPVVLPDLPRQPHQLVCGFRFGESVRIVHRARSIGYPRRSTEVIFAPLRSDYVR